MASQNFYIEQPSGPDGPSPRSHDQLTALLSEEGRDHVSDLPAQDATRLAEHLDGVLDTPAPASSVSQGRLRLLRRICGTRRILPESYALSSAQVITGSHPVASGAIADIYEGTLNGRKVRIKQVRVYSNGDPRGIQESYQEAVTWKHMKHMNIVPFRGVTIAPLQLISDWMPGGDLLQYINRNPDANRLRLLCDIAEGLKHLHSCHIVHGDLKGPSILVDDTGRACLSDFELSAVTPDLESTALARKYHSIRWTAPEILGGKISVSKETDIYSLGMVVIEAFSGDVPFADSTPTSVTTKVLSGERPERPKDLILTDGLWDLTQRCLDQDPRQRPEITGMACDLRRALVAQQDHADATDVARAKGTTLGETRRWEPPCRASSFTTPFQVTLGGLKVTCSPVFARRFWRPRKLKRTPLEPGPASDKAYGIKSEESRHRFHCVKLGDLGAPMGVQSTPSNFRSSWRRTCLWPLTCGASSARDHSNRPDNSSEKQGTFLKFNGVPDSSRTDSSAPVKRSLIHRLFFLSCTSSKSMVQ